MPNKVCNVIPLTTIFIRLEKFIVMFYLEELIKPMNFHLKASYTLAANNFYGLYFDNLDISIVLFNPVY